LSSDKDGRVCLRVAIIPFVIRLIPLFCDLTSLSPSVSAGNPDGSVLHTDPVLLNMPSHISVKPSPIRQDNIATPASRHGRVFSPFTPVFTPFTPFTPIYDWLPLPPETYPRTLERPVRNLKFYAVLGAILCLWSVTPLSWYVASIHLWAHS